MKRTKHGDELATFANALRNYLGLAPLHQVGLQGSKKRRPPTELERFHVLPPVPFSRPKRPPGQG